MSSISKGLEEQISVLKAQGYIVIPTQKYIIAKDVRHKNLLYRLLIAPEYEVIGEYDVSQLSRLKPKTRRTLYRPTDQMFGVLLWISAFLIVLGMIYSAATDIILIIGAGIFIGVTLDMTYTSHVIRREFFDIFDMKEH